MKELEEKLNNVLGYLTAMSFDNPELANTLEQPLNELSEATEIVNNFVLDPVSKSLPTDEEIEMRAEEALFGFGKGRQYDDDYGTGYEHGSKWVRGQSNVC